jgi:hypothetical protein
MFEGSKLWQGCPAETVLEELILHWRSGGKGFSIWGDQLVRTWLEGLPVQVRVSFRGSEGRAGFVAKYATRMYMVRVHRVYATNDA